VDQGWAYNLADRQWELLGAAGDLVAQVPDEALTRLGEVNERGARNGWPPLIPGAPYWHLVLRRGPEDGRHVYLPPGGVAEPPETLLCSAPPVVVFAAAIPSGLALPEGTGSASYRRQIQICGHGRACSYPYMLDRGLW
jgi:hypothetical protein